MNILICTSLDLNTPCAALNRINSLSKAVKPHGIDIYTCGSGERKIKNYVLKKNKVFFSNQRRFFLLPNALKYNVNAAQFYTAFLEEIINLLNIKGIIIYSMFSTMIEPISKVGRKKGIFVVNDGGEKYSVNLQNILNGVNYMQYRAIFYSFKKLQGMMVCSPRWKKYAKSIKKPSIFLPSFMPQEINQKQILFKNKNKFRIVFMGSFSPREMPKTLLSGFIKCLDLGYDFELVIIGRQGFNFLQKISWRNLNRKINKNKNIIFTNFVSSKERDSWLNSADCFVLLRPPCKETYHLFPTRLPEYFLTGKPVIISGVEPFNLFYEHKKEVYFISKKNSSNDLAKGFIELFNDPSLCKLIGDNGKRYAKKNYSSSYLGKKVSDFLKYQLSEIN